jgi:hypothetical protein
LYFAQGDITGSVIPDPSGEWDPTFQNANFVLGTGNGSTTKFAGAAIEGHLGEFFSADLFRASAAAGQVVTVEVIAYNGASYASSSLRAHSAAFPMTTRVGQDPTPNIVGNFMLPFSINIPEPSGFGLMGAGGIAMLISRRRNK